MAQFIFKYLRADGSVVTTRKMNFRFSSLAYGYAQALLRDSYGSVDSIDVQRVETKAESKSKSKSLDGNSDYAYHQAKIAAFKAKLALLEAKKNKRKRR